MARTVHAQPLRESAELRVETLGDERIRLGLWRRSAASTDPADFALVAGFAVSASDARELRSALALAISEVEAEA